MGTAPRALPVPHFWAATPRELVPDRLLSSTGPSKSVLLCGLTPQKDTSYYPWAGQENSANAPLQRCAQNTQMEHLAGEAFSSQCKASGPRGHICHIEVLLQTLRCVFPS